MSTCTILKSLNKTLIEILKAKVLIFYTCLLKTDTHTFSSYYEVLIVTIDLFTEKVFLTVFVYLKAQQTN